MNETTIKRSYCKNIGCPESFRWPTQLRRHLDECKYEKFTKIKKYESRDGLFVCLKCSKTFKRQICFIKEVKKKIYKSSKCEKEFKFKCRLKKHLKLHELEELRVCKDCNKRFKRLDHFLSHKNICVASATDFLPSFVPNQGNFTRLLQVESEDQVTPKILDNTTVEQSDPESSLLVHEPTFDPEVVTPGFVVSEDVNVHDEEIVPEEVMVPDFPAVEVP